MEKATIYDYVRLCKTVCGCENCPIGIDHNGINVGCEELIENYTDIANEIILKWCKEHPVKTKQDKFLEMFPNAKIDNCETSILCPRWVDKDFKCDWRLLRCAECRKEYWLAEVEE